MTGKKPGTYSQTLHFGKELETAIEQKGAMMDVSVSQDQNSVTYTITGAIDEQGAQTLKLKFRALDKNQVKKVVLDFAGVTHIGSAGIGKLLLLYRDLAINGGEIHIVNISETIYSLMTTLKLESVFKIETPLS